MANYHFTTDMTNQAIAWARFQQALTPDKPFFMYYAPGALHAPHHVARSGSRSTRASSIRAGTSCARRRSRDRFKLGVVPAGTKLTPRPKEIPAWDSLSADQKRLFAQADGDLRRLRRADRSRSRPPGAGHQGHGRDRQHVVHLHRRRQRLERRRRPGRKLQRDPRAERDRQRRVVTAQAHRRVGRTQHVPALRGGLGARRRHAVPVDQAGGVALRRHPQRHGDLVAGADQGARRGSIAVPSRHRHRADGAGSRRAAAADDGQRHQAAGHGRRVDGLHLRRCQGAGSAADAVLRDVREPRDLSRRLGRGDTSLDPLAVGAASARRPGPLGALPRGRGFQRGQRSGGAESAEAEGAAGPLHPGGDQEPRAPDRRPSGRALRRSASGPARSHGHSDVADAL